MPGIGDKCLKTGLVPNLLKHDKTDQYLKDNGTHPKNHRPGLPRFV
ncbi:MAG: hypothetical protein RLZZ28_486 [Bacteroidota bacterium]|jgi:hypothetical protein